MVMVIVTKASILIFVLEIFEDSMALAYITLISLFFNAAWSLVALQRMNQDLFLQIKLVINGPYHPQKLYSI